MSDKIPITWYCTKCGSPAIEYCKEHHPSRIIDLVPREIDPAGLHPSTPGAKTDAGKEPVDEGLFDYFALALLEVAKVSGAGAEKYKGFGGWRKVENKEKRYANALGRHTLKRHAEGKFDKDGMRHRAQIAWNALLLLQLELEEEHE